MGSSQPSPEQFLQEELTDQGSTNLANATNAGQHENALDNNNPPRRHRAVSFSTDSEPPMSRENSASFSFLPFSAGQAPLFRDNQGVAQNQADPFASPLPRLPWNLPSKSVSNCSSLTRFGGDEQDGDGGPEEHQRGLPHRDENNAEVAQPTGKVSDESLVDAVPKLCAIDVVGDYERYKRAYCYPLSHFEYGKNMIARGPHGTSLDLPPSERRGWKGFLHPEGTRYFFYDGGDAPVPVITEAWLYNDECYGQVERFREEIFGYMAKNQISFPEVGLSNPREKDAPMKGQEFPLNGEGQLGGTKRNYFQSSAPVVLVLELRLSGNCGYYFVDHARQRLFWLDDYDFSYAAGELHVEHADSIIGMEMKRHYWRHNEYFPHLYEFTEEDLEYMDDMIGFTFGDMLTSETSAVNSYSTDQLKNVTKMMARHSQKSSDQRKKSVGERRTICRVVSDLYHERFLNLHGERGVRLDSKQSIHYSPHRRKRWVPKAGVTTLPETNERRRWYRRLLSAFFPKQDDVNDEEKQIEILLDAGDPEPSPKAKAMHRSSLMMNIATLFMFGGPYVHAKRLKDITLDQIVNKSLLAQYTEKMVAEWRDVALYGTVLLGANVSFLTIQSVDTVLAINVSRTPAQRASYFSILASLGTIVSSLVLLILVRHREVMGIKLIQARSQSRWGLEALALMYGTPFSLVIWAILGFFISFALMWFHCKDLVVIGIVVVCLVSFAIFLVWAVSPSFSEQEPYEMIVKKTANRVKTGAIDAVGTARKVGDKMRKGSIEVTRGAKRRVSTILAEPSEKRSRYEHSGYGGERCASPERMNPVSGRTTLGSLELKNGERGPSNAGDLM